MPALYPIRRVRKNAGSDATECDWLTVGWLCCAGPCRSITSRRFLVKAELVSNGFGLLFGLVFDIHFILIAPQRRSLFGSPVNTTR